MPGVRELREIGVYRERIAAGSTITERPPGARSTVCDFAERARISRAPRQSHDQLVELVVSWFVGDHLAEEDRHVVSRVGCQLTPPGLRSLERLDAATDDDVRRRLAEVLADG